MAKVDVIKAQVSVTDRRRRSKSIERKRVAAYCRVSTDSEDQLNSYRSQVQYYTDKISENVDWMMAGIYADEGITGTQVAKRDGFQKMINHEVDFTLCPQYIGHTEVCPDAEGEGYRCLLRR